MTEPYAFHEIGMVTTTVATEAEARRMAQAVLQARQAACVQVEPITSHFRWQGALQEDREWRVTCKTAADSMEPLMRLLKSIHPYAVPQLVAQRLLASCDYGRWVDGEATPAATLAATG